LLRLLLRRGLRLAEGLCLRLWLAEIETRG